MPTTLNDIVLSDDLEWVDEMAWSPVAQAVEVTSGGALVVQESKQLAGRPITLESGSEGSTYWGVATRETVEQLRELAFELLEEPMTLELADGRTFDVRFRHGDNGFEARPIREAVMPAADADLYTIILRLFEV
jgi:hypothetical protein